MTENDPLTKQPAICIHQNALSQFSSCDAIIPQLRSQPASPSQVQMDSAAAPISKPFHQAQPAEQFATNVNMTIPPTAKESV